MITLIVSHNKTAPFQARHRNFLVLHVILSKLIVVRIVGFTGTKLIYDFVPTVSVFVGARRTPRLIRVYTVYRALDNRGY